MSSSSLKQADQVPVKNKRQKIAPLELTYEPYKQLLESKPLRAVGFNDLDDSSHCCAIAGGNLVTCFVLDENESPSINLGKRYVDEDENESFVAVIWAAVEDIGAQDRILILAGSVTGKIRVIDAENFNLAKTLEGHRQAVNDIKLNPFHDSLVLSTSNDYTIRLWSVINGQCLAKIYGTQKEVLSADFHLANKYLLASSGLDKNIRVWHMSECWRSNWMDNDEDQNLEVNQCARPIKLNGMQNNDVECLRFMDDSILSQMGDFGTVLSTFPGHYAKMKYKKADVAQGRAPVTIKNFQIQHSGKSKFKTNGNRVLAVGNKKGEIYVLDCQKPKSAKIITRSQNLDSEASVRETAISSDGSKIVSIDEAGIATVWFRTRINER